MQISTNQPQFGMAMFKKSKAEDGTPQATMVIDDESKPTPDAKAFNIKKEMELPDGVNQDTFLGAMSQLEKGEYLATGPHAKFLPELKEYMSAGGNKFRFPKTRALSNALGKLVDATEQNEEAGNKNAEHLKAAMQDSKDKDSVINTLHLVQSLEKKSQEKK